MIGSTLPVYGLYGDQRLFGAQSQAVTGNQTGLSSSLQRLYALNGVGGSRSALLSDPPGLINTAALGQRYTDSVSLSQQGKVQVALADLRQALQPLAVAGSRAPAKATSGNETVLTASMAAGSSLAAPQTVTVNQLARGQQIESANSASRSDILGTGRLTIQPGRVSESGFETAGTARQVIINPADASLAGVAAGINRANAGVTAEVVTDADGSRLQISSQQSGAAAAFRITVSDDDGNNGDSAGLSRLAFEPGNAASHATQTQAAQNASVNVGSRTLTAASNTVADRQTGLTLNLLASGSSEVGTATDTAALAASVQRFATAYNATQQQLAGLDATQAVLAQKQLDRALVQLTGSSGVSASGLESLGMTRARDGSLQVNDKALAAAVQKSPDSVASQLATAAQRLDSAAQSAQGTNLGVSLRAVRNTSASDLQALNTSIGPFSLLQVGGYSFALNSRTLYGLSQYLTVASF